MIGQVHLPSGMVAAGSVPIFAWAAGGEFFNVFNNFVAARPSSQKYIITTNT
jgi:hypothetical protein